MHCCFGLPFLHTCWQFCISKTFLCIDQSLHVVCTFNIDDVYLSQLKYSSEMGIATTPTTFTMQKQAHGQYKDDCDDLQIRSPYDTFSSSTYLTNFLKMAGVKSGLRVL